MGTGQITDTRVQNVASVEPDHGPSALGREQTIRGVPLFVSGLKVLLCQMSLLAVSLLPRSIAFEIARALGRWRYRRRPRLLAPVRKEMEQVLGPGEHVDRSLKRYFEVVSCEALEAYMHRLLTKERMRQVIEFRGLENLETALDKGKGAILCTGHVSGLFTFFVGMKLLGYKLNAVRRRPPGLGGPIASWFSRRNTLVGERICNFLWMDKGANLRLGMHSAAALNRNEILIILIDARQVSGSVEVSFLNRQVWFPSGHVVLAQGTGAPLLNFFIHRPETWFPQVVEIGKPFYPPACVEQGVQHCISLLEQDIRRHPAEWIWLSARDAGNEF